MRNRLTLALALFLAMAIFAAACAKKDEKTDDPEAKGLAALSGSVNADGSSTVFPISQAVAETFQEEAKNVKISVGTSGTGGGFKKFCSGEADISNASRPIKKGKPEGKDDAEKKGEVGLCADNGVEFVELTVAIDGLSVLVNPKNDFVKCLTVEELKKIWEPNSKVSNWSQVRSGFPDKKLSLYGPGTDSGTFDYFTDEIVGEEGASRSDYVASEDDNVLVQGVAGDENALGYFGYAYFEQNAKKLKAVGVDAGEGCVEPTRETINGGKYTPLSRPLFIYVAKKAAARKEVAAFIDFYLESVNDLVAEVGYIALPDEKLKAEIDEWKAFKPS